MSLRHTSIPTSVNYEQPGVANTRISFLTSINIRRIRVDKLTLGSVSSEKAGKKI